MSGEQGTEITAFYNRVKWIILVLFNLSKQRFSGTLILELHEGNLSEKYKRQVTERAPK